MKVSADASNVGLGWNLNVGGLISKRVNGFDDELPRGYYYGTESGEKLVKDYLSIQNGSYVESDEPIEDYKRRIEQLIGDGNLDTQVDMYSYNFMGFSGDFYFNSDGEIELLYHENLKITRTAQNKFQVIYGEVAAS